MTSLPFSANTLTTLLALLHDARQIESDAKPMLDSAARELAALSPSLLPAGLRQNPRKLAALQQAGFARNLSGGSMLQMTAGPVTRP